MKTLTLAFALLALASPAFAQSRFFVSVNGAWQATANDFEDSSTMTVNAEEGEQSLDYRVKAAPTFDVSGGMRLNARFTVGAGVSRFSVSTPAHFTASVPHPFFFNRDRTVEADFDNADRQELAVHAQVRWLMPLGDRLELALSAGPSFFKVRQQFPLPNYGEAYPYDTLEVVSVVAEISSGSTVGFNVGGDVSYFFARNVGVGGLVQFSGATLDMDVEDRDVTVKAGGLRVGAGIRVRF